MVEVKLLGGLEVVVEGRSLELTRKKERALIAMLALRLGEVVSTDVLVDGIWDESPPKSAVASLQNLVSALRKALGPHIATRSPGYVLDVPRERIDVFRFEALVDDAVGTGDPKAKASSLRRALDLWRGPALGDFAYAWAGGPKRR